MNRLNSYLFAGMLLGTVCLLPAVSRAQTVEGGKVVVNQTGDVIATYRGNSASYSNDLYLDSPTNSLGLIFNNHESPVGSQVNLGSFTAGTELIFRLHVRNTDEDFFTGPAERNPGEPPHTHARVTYDWSPTEALVEFEDLRNGSFDYNDLSFSFTNIRSSSDVPEPGTLALLVGTGVSGLTLLRRRRLRA